jgi:gamma-glutamylcyclotransferase (GGCT)/AIG2-like uncharacterized protein YtfP
MIDFVFVYGTLKRGECREHCWPHAPREVEPATCRGELYDLGAHPALIEGDDVVRGEVWYIAREHMAETLQAIDRIEDYCGDPEQENGSDLYLRRPVMCRYDDGQVVTAWTYRYAKRAELTPERRIVPNARGECEWKGSR